MGPEVARPDVNLVPGRPNVAKVPLDSPAPPIPTPQVRRTEPAAAAEAAKPEGDREAQPGAAPTGPAAAAPESGTAQHAAAPARPGPPVMPPVRPVRPARPVTVPGAPQPRRPLTKSIRPPVPVRAARPRGAQDPPRRARKARRDAVGSAGQCARARPAAGATAGQGLPDARNTRSHARAAERIHAAAGARARHAPADAGAATGRAARPATRCGQGRTWSATPETAPAAPTGSRSPGGEQDPAAQAEGRSTEGREHRDLRLRRHLRQGTGGEAGHQGEPDHQVLGGEGPVRNDQPAARAGRHQGDLHLFRSDGDRADARGGSGPRHRSGRDSRGHRDPPAGRHGDGPCRSRKDLLAGCDPRHERGGEGGRRHHAGNRRLPRRPGRQADRLHRYAGPRGLHQDALPRRRRDGHRRARGRS